MLELTIDLRHTYHTALFPLGEPDLLTANLGALVECAERHGDSHRVVLAKIDFANALWFNGEAVRALPVIEEAVAMAEALQDVRPQITAALDLGQIRATLGDHDAMVPGRDTVDDPAHQPGQYAVQNGHAFGAGAPGGRRCEAVGAAAGEGAGQIALVLTEYVDAYVLGPGDDRPAGGRGPHPEGDQRGLGGYRVERCGGESDRVLTLGGDHRDACGMLPEDGAKQVGRGQLRSAEFGRGRHVVLLEGCERGGGGCSHSRTARARVPGEVHMSPPVEKEF